MDLLNLLAQSQANGGYPMQDLARLAESGMARQAGVESSPAVAPEPADGYTPDAGAQTDNTYRFERQARLDYSMTLQFDLSSFTRTVARIANGDTQALEQYATASFGLTADMSFEGYQRIREFSDVDPAQARSIMRSTQAAQSGRSAQITWQNRQFQIQNFMSEASRVRRGLSHLIQKNHLFATNSLAARYRFDNSLSMKYLSSFNQQTQRMADNSPESLNNYLTTAASVAQTAPGTMLAGFFEATEGYLDAAEQNLTAKAGEYFDMAAEELGFDGELVDMAREQLVGTVTRFFDRVDAAVDQLQGYYSDQSQSSQVLAGRFAGPERSQSSSFLAFA